MAVSANRLELLQIADAVAREKLIDKEPSTLDGSDTSEKMIVKAQERVDKIKAAGGTLVPKVWAGDTAKVPDGALQMRRRICCGSVLSMHLPGVSAGRAAEPGRSPLAFMPSETSPMRPASRRLRRASIVPPGATARAAPPAPARGRRRG